MSPLGILGGVSWSIKLYIHDLRDDVLPGDVLPDGDGFTGGSGGLMRL